MYRESNSVLASRNAHSINFGNEIGHQIEFNRIIFGNKNLLGNLSMSYRHQNEKMVETIAKMHPLKRLGEGSDSSSLAKFLLGNNSEWITGQILGVDGGRSSLT